MMLVLPINQSLCLTLSTDIMCSVVGQMNYLHWSCREHWQPADIETSLHCGHEAKPLLHPQWAARKAVLKDKNYTHFRKQFVNCRWQYHWDQLLFTQLMLAYIYVRQQCHWTMSLTISRAVYFVAVSDIYSKWICQEKCWFLWSK